MPVTFSGGSALPVVGSASYNAAASGSGSGSYNSSTGQLSINGTVASAPQASSAIPPGWSPQAWSQQQADMAKYFPTPSSSVQQPVAAGNLGNSTAANLPGAPTTPNYNGAISRNNASLGLTTDANGNFNFGTPTAATDGTGKPASSSEDYFKQYLGLMKPPESTADIYQKALDDTGVQQKRQLVNNLTGQLNSIVAKSQADQLSVAGKGMGIPEVIIGGQQAQISKEAAIQSLPVQAQLAAAQGDLALAQEHLDTLFKIRSADATASVDYNNKIVGAVYEFATKQEQQKLDQLKTDRATNLSQINNSLDYAQSLSTLAVNNEQAGLGGKIAALTPPDPASSNFAKELINYNKQVAVLESQIRTDPLKQAQIEKIRGELSASGTSMEASQVLAYAQQYASNGQIPTGLPKGAFGAVSQVAKELPKQDGAIVDAVTGVKSSKFSSTQEDTAAIMKDLVNRSEQLKKTYNDTGLLSTASQRQMYNDQRNEMVDLLARLRTGAVINPSELATYEAKLPKLVNIGTAIPFSGNFLDITRPSVGNQKIDDFSSSIGGKLNTMLKTNGQVMYGYSTVNLGGTNYKVGDVIEVNGVRGRVLPDGTISQF